MIYSVKFMIDGYELEIKAADLERALALAGLLQKIATSEVKYDNLSINPKN